MLGKVYFIILKSKVSILLLGTIICVNACQWKQNNGSINNYSGQQSTNATALVLDTAAQQPNNTLETNLYETPYMDTVCIFALIKDKSKSFSYKNDTLEVQYGNLFSPKQKHLMIRFKARDYYSEFFWFYIPQKHQFERIFSYRQGLLTYQCYKIYDVNGDGLKDFAVQWHPASGGTDSYNIYLLKRDEINFTDEFSFHDAYFDSKRRIVLEPQIGYGIYKIKWKNRYILDTIQSVHYCDSPESYFSSDSVNIRNNCKNCFLVDYTKNKKVSFIDSIPAEYDSLFKNEEFKRSKYDCKK